jgi:hypothetical protein
LDGLAVLPTTIRPHGPDIAIPASHRLVREGGFAPISGDPGTSKSVVLRLLGEQLP